MIRKKWLYVGVVAVCMLGLVAGACAKPAPAPTSAPTVSPAPAPVVTKWKANTHQVRTSPKDFEAFQDLKKKIEDYTEGRVQVELYFGGELVPAADQLDALGKGVIDLAWTYTGYWSGKLPGGLGLLEGGGTLFWLNIWDCFDVFWNWGLGDLLAPEYAKFNVQYLTQSVTNYVTMWSKVPIRTLDDIKRVKVRSAGVGATMLAGMGASVVSIPLTEVYTALLTGTVDAATWGGYGADIGGKLHEVTDYVLISPFVWAGNEHVIASMNSWNKLSARDQFLVKEAARANTISAQYIWFTQDLKARGEIMAKKPSLTELYITDPAYLAKRAEVRNQMLVDWEKASPQGAQAVKIFKSYLTLHGIK